MLILAHTPKRDFTKPISRNDLKGSKELINFCDSCFAIGESHRENGLRYLKQIKARNTEIIYDSDNVIEMVVEKDYNFLHLKFIGYGSESDHLKQWTDKEKSELEDSIIDYKTESPQATQQEIADKLGTNKMRVSRVLKKRSADNSE